MVPIFLSLSVLREEPGEEPHREPGPDAHREELPEGRQPRGFERREKRRLDGGIELRERRGRSRAAASIAFRSHIHAHLRKIASPIAPSALQRRQSGSVKTRTRAETVEGRPQIPQGRCGEAADRDRVCARSLLPLARTARATRGRAGALSSAGRGASTAAHSTSTTSEPARDLAERVAEGRGSSCDVAVVEGESVSGRARSGIVTTPPTHLCASLLREEEDGSGAERQDRDARPGEERA